MTCWRFIAALICVLAASAPAIAHARLTAAAPAANSNVTSPPQIRLQFSESLEPVFSGAGLSDAGGRAVPVRAAIGDTTITLVPPALKPGLYTVTWHSVGRDTHRVTGRFTFRVIP